jgi:hypothetical protein
LANATAQAKDSPLEVSSSECIDKPSALIARIFHHPGFTYDNNFGHELAVIFDAPKDANRILGLLLGSKAYVMPWALGKKHQPKR